MAKVHIHSGQGAVGTGDLQLQNGAPMDATLRPVTDAANTASPLELSTGLVAVTSTLQIATNDTEYIDAEDGSGNNRFTVSRASGSQVVNVDYASNPTAGTDQVGAIRTYEDGANLSDSVSFLRNGNVGIGTAAPSAKAEIANTDTSTYSATAVPIGAVISRKNNSSTLNQAVGLRFDVTGWAGSTTGVAGISAIQSASNSSTADIAFQTRNAGNIGERMRITSAGNVGIGTNNPDTTLRVKGIGGFLDSSLNDTGVRVGANENYYWQISRENLSFGYLSIIEKDNTTPVERLRFTQATAGSYLRLASGTGGIQFNGDTAAANALDDYEEGTWTPVFGGDATLGSYTYSVGSGSYTKIGRQVTVWCALIDLTEVIAGSGQMIVQGLPFTIANTTVLARLSTVPYIRQGLTTRNNLIAIGGQNSTKIYLQYDNNAASGGNPLTIAGDFNPNMDIGLVLTYYV